MVYLFYNCVLLPRLGVCTVVGGLGVCNMLLLHSHTHCLRHVSGYSVVIRRSCPCEVLPNYVDARFDIALGLTLSRGFALYAVRGHFCYVCQCCF